MVSYNDANRDDRWPTIHPDEVPTCVHDFVKRTHLFRKDIYCSKCYKLKVIK